MDFDLDLVVGNTLRSGSDDSESELTPAVCLGNLLASDQIPLHPIFNRTLETMFLDQCLFLLVELDHFTFIPRSLQSKPLRLGRPSDSGRPPLCCSDPECRSHGGQIC